MKSPDRYCRATRIGADARRDAQRVNFALPIDFLRNLVVLGVNAAIIFVQWLFCHDHLFSLSGSLALLSVPVPFL